VHAPLDDEQQPIRNCGEREQQQRQRDQAPILGSR
jgi:hypothetical protein